MHTIHIAKEQSKIMYALNELKFLKSKITADEIRKKSSGTLWPVIM